MLEFLGYVGMAPETAAVTQSNHGKSWLLCRIKRTVCPELTEIGKQKMDPKWSLSGDEANE